MKFTLLTVFKWTVQGHGGRSPGSACVFAIQEKPGPAEGGDLIVPVPPPRGVMAAPPEAKAQRRGDVSVPFLHRAEPRDGLCLPTPRLPSSQKAWAGGARRAGTRGSRGAGEGAELRRHLLGTPPAFAASASTCLNCSTRVRVSFFPVSVAEAILARSATVPAEAGAVRRGPDLRRGGRAGLGGSEGGGGKGVVS